MEDLHASIFEAQGGDIWNVVVNGLFVPTSVVNDIGTFKIKTAWNEDDKKKSYL